MNAPGDARNLLMDQIIVQSTKKLWCGQSVYFNYKMYSASAYLNLNELCSVILPGYRTAIHFVNNLTFETL